MGSIKSGGAAAARIGQYKKPRRCRNEKWAVYKARALPQQDLVSIKSGGAAATSNGQYEKPGLLPQRELVSIKSAGAATTRNGQYKKRGRCRRENY